MKKPEHLLAPALLGIGVLAFLAAWAHRLAIGAAPSAGLALLLALSGFLLALYAAPRAGLWGTLALVAAGAGLGGVWNANLALFTVLSGLLLYLGLRRRLPEPAQAAFWGWAFVWPSLALVLVWHVFPSLYAFYISLFDRVSFIAKSRFVGLLNYQILFHDPLFWRALSNTFWYVVFTVPTGIVLGTLVAILLNERVRFLGLFRTLYFLPYITALTAAAAVWMWIYHPEFGFLNWLLGTPGFDWLHTPDGVFALLLRPLGVELKGFLAGPSVAFVAIMAMSVWHLLGYNVVILLAGLQSIPRQYYEAAMIDGATWWQLQRYITWPLLSPTTFFLAIIGLIGAFQVFTQVYVMTPTGGVLNDTLTVTMYLYNKGFRDSDFSYASAIAVVVFFVILALTLLQKRVLERRVTYGE